jgi:predicted  nucleic acid-binding Zn-ribbon protein
MNKISVSHMNNSQSRWLRSLDFYKNELNVLKNMLTEVMGKNNAPSVRKKVEHYENQFKVQNNNIDGLVHEIKDNNSRIAAGAKGSSAGYIDGELFTVHNQLEQRFDSEEQTINTLRHEFQRFAADWM